MQQNIIISLLCLKFIVVYAGPLFFLSSRPRELYLIENLHPPGHPVTAAILRATIKETAVRTRQVDSGSDTYNNNNNNNNN